MDRHNWYYRYKPNTTWLLDFIEDIETADRSVILALTSTLGVSTGLDVTENDAGQDFSVDVSAGIAFDPIGRRIFNATETNVPFTTDYLGDPIEVVGGGNDRIVSVYAHHKLVDDVGTITVDGNGDTVYLETNEEVEFVLVQGVEGVSPTPAADPGNNGVLLANVTIHSGDSTIANSDIDTSVRYTMGLSPGTGSVGAAEVDWGLGANQVSAEDVPIRDTAGNFVATDVEAALIELYDKLLPIGGIIGHYDYNGALVPNSTVFKSCDGSTQTVGALGSQTLPDLSNRYLVGFGTEGGGDNDSAAWSTTPVGNASHQVNLQHAHTVNSHTHTGPSHTHTMANHTHAGGTLAFRIGTQGGGAAGAIKFYDSTGSSFSVGNSTNLSLAAGGSSYDFLLDTGVANTVAWAGVAGSPANSGVSDVPSTNTSDAGGTGATGAATPGTDSQGSTTQSIQPRSVRVRWYMRVI